MSEMFPKFHGLASPEILLFFAPLADVLNRFAVRHNLKLEPYEPDSSCWFFIFRHPKGGVGYIEVWRKSASSLTISIHWWIDDFDKYRRFLRSNQTPEYETDSIDLGVLLEDNLKTLLAWDKKDLLMVDIDYSRYWKPYRDSLLNYEERYPELKE